MGITGLIPFLEKASSKVHLKDLGGCTVAIDSYCWLHKGVFSCADKLVRGEDTDQYIKYCLKYVQMLLSFNIKPILVFDGQHLPAKALTEKRRRESRRESKKRAAELLRLGKIDEARSHMRRCVDVTHTMALRLIKECRLRNVDCIVAPFEADAQMAWLNKAGIAQYVITEDSDLTLFGASKIIFKLDLTGAGLLVEADKLYMAMGCGKERYNFDKFRRMCILSGCDYLDSLPGIGLAKACKFMLKTEQEDMWIALKKIPQYLNMRHLQVEDEYIENFLKAEATFKHMYIYNPLERKMDRLHPLEDFQTDERYCSNAGNPLENNEQALNLALGNLDPFTLKQLDNWHPDSQNSKNEQALPKHIKRAKHKSIWQSFNSKTDIVFHTKSKEVNCALYFKKVNFLSKTIDQDIKTNLKEENAKSTEAEIFAIYKSEAQEYALEPEQKRRKYCSESDNEMCIKVSSPPQSQHLLKTLHNPFMKTEKISIECSPRKATVCANSSLLKVLSPKKFQIESQQIELKHVESIKRKMFTSSENKVEVRSRFFAENVQYVKEAAAAAASETSNSCLVDLSAEIEEIEKKAQRQMELQSLLYDSPSPKKKLILKESPGLDKPDNESGFVSSESKTKIQPMDGAQSIELSDEEESNIESVSKSSRSAFPRKSSLTAKSNKKKPKTFIKKLKVDGNQQRLSMFGFQKRPVLK